MKNIIKISLIIFIILISGCSDVNDGRIGVKDIKKNNTVDDVINKQIEKTNSLTDEDNLTVGEESTKEETKQIDEHNTIDYSKKVDYDLTLMNKDMVYGIIYDMITDPDKYIGKTFRIEGLYYANYHKSTDKYYHYCVVEDALACCAQGLEFIWDGGPNIYPDEYPENNTGIVIEGVFETYEAESYDFSFCRIKDSKVKLIND
ncbi:MAG: hypothetical protein QM266_08160 [Bacillota bacterium]|nr:hypothetical protein [Bacillota bacterium]